MKKVYQTRTGEKGNCFNACLASILEIDIKQLPDADLKNKDGCWLKRFHPFLKAFGLSIHICHPVGSNKIINGYAIGSFERSHGKCTHAIVCYNGRKKHDPFPVKFKNKAAKVGKLVYWVVITVLDPKSRIKQ